MQLMHCLHSEMVLGLDPDDAYAIAAAADGRADDPLLRQQLLAALALLDPVAP